MTNEPRPTAEILGNYRRQLLAEGIDEESVIRLVEAAADRFIATYGLRADSEPTPPAPGSTGCCLRRITAGPLQ